MSRPDNFYINGLVNAAKLGSTDAFCELYAATVNTQFELACCFLMGNREKALEAIKEAYVTALCSIGTQKDASTFISDLNRNNLQLCCAMLGGESRKTGIDNVALRQILALPGNEGPAFYLKYLRGLSFQRISNMLCMDLPELFRCYADGRKRLKLDRSLRPRGRRLLLYSLDVEAADRLLDEILEICSCERSGVAYQELETYTTYRKERFVFQKIILLVLMFVFIAVPLCFISPDFSIAPISDGLSITYEITVNNHIPVKNVSASVNDTGLPVRQTGKSVYRVSTDMEGELRIRVRLINGQYKVLSTYASPDDNEAPVLISQRVEDGKVIYEVEDNGSGIDYEGVYAEEAGSGLFRYPEEYGDGYIVFAFPKEKSYLYIPDLCGNRLTVVISVDKG